MNVLASLIEALVYLALVTVGAALVFGGDDR